MEHKEDGHVRSVDWSKHLEPRQLAILTSDEKKRCERYPGQFFGATSTVE